MDLVDQLVKDNQAVLAARAAGQDAAYRQDLATVRDELRPRADLTRRQLPALEAERRKTLAFADTTDRLAQQIAAGGARAVAQDLANWAGDLRIPFLGGGRGGFATTPPIEESRAALARYDDETAFVRHFSPALLADAHSRRVALEQFRAGLGRVDGYLSSIRSLRGQIERLLQDHRDADPPAGVMIATGAERPAPPADIPVQTEFDPRRT